MRNILELSPIIVKDIAGWRKIQSALASKNQSIGLVPTMVLHTNKGALHAGHLSLVSLARQQCDIVVASIFVNPAQFSESEDLPTYPSTLQDDFNLLTQEKVDYIFAPSILEMYPLGIPLNPQAQSGTFVTVHGKSHQIEGSLRPHFFRGVATIVCKLFNIIQPARAYFGQKDVQQCSVIRSMVRDLFYPIEIVIASTVRESDGLAMSSRNRYLNPKERELAPILYKAIQASQVAYNCGMVDSAALIRVAKDIIESKNVTLNYLSISEPFALKEVEGAITAGILSGSIELGNTRIIDNVLLGMDSNKL